MSNRIAHDTRTWLGLVLESSGCAAQQGVLREILGNESVLLVVRKSQSMLEAIGETLDSGATSILTVAGDDRVPELRHLVHALCNLSSIRRVVVLHDATTEAAQLFESIGILMLRDSRDVRAALRALVQKETTLIRREGALGSISQSLSV